MTSTWPDNKTRAQFMQEITTCWQMIEQQKTEIERLRGLLGDVQIILDSHNNIVGNLNGEITRLRGLLREGLDHHDEYNWQQRVREVLGE